MILFLWGSYLDVEERIYTVGVCLTLQEIMKLFSK